MMLKEEQQTHVFTSQDDSIGFLIKHWVYIVYVLIKCYNKGFKDVENVILIEVTASISLRATILFDLQRGLH